MFSKNTAHPLGKDAVWSPPSVAAQVVAQNFTPGANTYNDQGDCAAIDKSSPTFLTKYY